MNAIKCRQENPELTGHCAGGCTGGQEAAGEALPMPMSPGTLALLPTVPKSWSPGEGTSPPSPCSSTHIPGWLLRDSRTLGVLAEL